MPQTERDKYISKLQSQLGRVMSAQDFANSEGGKLIIQLLDNDVNSLRQDIESNKFINDHQGYVDARAKLSYAKSLLSRIAKTSDPKQETVLRQEIDVAKGKTGEDDGDGTSE